MRSAVVGEPEILERHGAVALEVTPQSSPQRKGITYRGWNFWYTLPAPNLGFSPSFRHV
jgi:hypothetical protein